MFGSPRTRLALFSMALAVVLIPVSAVDAAWVTIQNDTNRVIVVQTAVTVNGQLRRGKPMRLLPGEVLRELYGPPAISVEVYDAQNPNKPILSTPLAIKNENQGFSLSTTPQGLVLGPVEPPAKKPETPPKK